MAKQELICGHELEVLKWALSLHATGVDTGIAADIDRRANGIAQRYYASEAIHDPAKLATIIAELLRERGVDVGNSPFNEFVVGSGYHQVGVGTRMDIVWIRENDGERIAHLLTLPKARAFALRLLDAPADADVQKLIGEIAQ